MSWNSLIFPAKKIRAEVIRAYVERAGYRGVVCFSCGNATRALRDAGLYVVDVAPGGSLQAGRWWDAAEIRRAWPDLLDATSGHLPAPLLREIAAAFKAHLGDLRGYYHEIPTGSGETLVCLAMAYPGHKFRPVYGQSDATQYEPQAPLNDLVLALQS